VRLLPSARKLQQLAYLLRRQRLRDVLERDCVLHHLVEAFDLVELQHRLGIEAIAHGLHDCGRDLGLLIQLEICGLNGLRPLFDLGLEKRLQKLR
jgi:hypothetical protein